MPVHIYICSVCEHQFEHTQRINTEVKQRRSCPLCLNTAEKSWANEHLVSTVIDGGEYYFEEQLGRVICRGTTKREMRNIELETDGRVRPEWY